MTQKVVTGMDTHPALREVVAGFEANALHAARAGREVMGALAAVAADTPAETAEALVTAVEGAVDVLLAAMPAYAPPLNVMHRVMACIDSARREGLDAAGLRSALLAEAATYRAWSERAREQIAAIGAAIVPEGGTVFTFTLSETAARTLLTAKEQGKAYRLLVTESRPNNDGRITARRLAEAGVPVGIGIDAGIGELVPRADVMIVGAEAIMADGSAVCKVGTYPAALVAQAHGVPVYVVADTMKFNVSSRLGIDLWLDEIADDDVLADPPAGEVAVAGRLFDRTPAHLIAGVVTERGIMSPAACSAEMGDMPFSQSLARRLHAWAGQSPHPEPKRE
jgi:ribose 1,5-bisphosphate isomerase